MDVHNMIPILPSDHYAHTDLSCLTISQNTGPFHQYGIIILHMIK